MAANMAFVLCGPFTFLAPLQDNQRHRTAMTPLGRSRSSGYLRKNGTGCWKSGKDRA